MERYKHIVLVLTLIFLAACNPFKVTDPSDPRFNPEQFRLKDYKSRQHVRETAKKLFDENSTKGYIELMLVERGGAGKAQDDDQPNNYRYHYHPKLLFSPKTTYRFSVIYDKNHKPICFQFNGETIIDRPCKFYGTELKPYTQHKEN